MQLFSEWMAACTQTRIYLCIIDYLRPNFGTAMSTVYCLLAFSVRKSYSAKIFKFQSHIFRVEIETPPEFTRIRSGIAVIHSQTSVSTLGIVQKCLHGFLGELFFATLKPISYRRKFASTSLYWITIAI